MTDADRAIEAAQRVLAKGLPVREVRVGRVVLVLAEEEREPDIDWRRK